MMTTDNMSPELDAALKRMVASFNIPEPRYRYFQRRNGPMFVWTVEAYHMPYDNPAEGKYESLIYEPIGKGSRSGKAKSWQVKDGSRSLHALRKDAKARALRLFREWEAEQRERGT